MAIFDALNALNQSLQNLEAIAAEQEKKAYKIGQTDLFSGTRTSLDPALIAQKLDITIERVEKLLAEG
ncbi:MAG: hypothetical protein CO093_05895 [Alphaproteobacteria bacterium CG_4_9_14_3_um_filter_47_13]|nr:MAG: hypothetical protein CO093_05895 [Alphaproteobacteria bacterium CG_4_9_14_3_um_filter_47_13]